MAFRTQGGDDYYGGVAFRTQGGDDYCYEGWLLEHKVLMIMMIIFTRGGF